MSNSGVPDFGGAPPPPPPPPSSDPQPAEPGNSNSSGCLTAFGVVAIGFAVLLFANRPSDQSRNDENLAGLADFVWVLMNGAAWILMVVGVIYVLVGRGVFRRRRR